MADAPSVGLPWHLGSHDDYTSAVYTMLDSLQADLLQQYGTITPSMARLALQGLANNIRKVIVGSGASCSINGVFP